MRFHKQIITFCFAISTLNALYASFISVRLLSDMKVTSLMVTPLFGEYDVYADGKLLTADSANLYLLTLKNDSIQLKALEKNAGTFSSIRFVGREYPNSLKIRSVSPDGKVKSFDDNIEITVFNQSLKIINKIDVEHYIGGVVECESGTKSMPEYYKLQSILCRTYALSNIRRHEAEGFNLCDQVHCQVYFNKSNNPEITNAAIDTKGLVITDNDLNLITAAFHSNCGGETVNSEDVWTMPTTYLKAIKDTFCLQQPHASWQRKIATEDWMTYLSLKHKYPIEDTSSYNNAISFPQQQENGNLLTGRQVYFIDKNLKIPLKTIRFDWQLKSTYFSIEQHSDSVEFKGRGYGHGIGLCQEGAMQMTKLGYSYKDIIHFYYSNTHLVDLSVLNFFREK